MKPTSLYLIGAVAYLQATIGESALLRASRGLAIKPVQHTKHTNSRSLTTTEEEESCDSMITSIEDEATDMMLDMLDQGTLIDYVCNPSVTEMIREAMISPGDYFLEHYNSTSSISETECSLELFVDTFGTIQSFLPDDSGISFDTDMCRSLVLQSLSSNGTRRELEPVSVGLALAFIIGLVVVGAIVAPVGLAASIAVPIVGIQRNREREEECNENCSTDEFYSGLDFGEDEFNIVLGGSPIYVLEVAPGDCNRGANIQLARQNGSSRQRFRLGADNSIESVHCSGLVVEVEGGESCNDNTNIQLWDYNGGANQQWFLTREGSYIAPGYTCFDDEVVPTIGVADDRITTGGNIELQWFDESDPGQGLQFMRAPNEDNCQRANAYVLCDQNFGTHLFDSMYIPEGSVFDVQILDGNYGNIFLGVVGGGANAQVQSVGSGQYIGGERGDDQTGDPADLPNFTFGPVSEAGYFAPFTSGPTLCHESPNHAYYVDLRFCIRET